MSMGAKILSFAALSTLAFAPTSAGAVEFYIAAKSHISGFSQMSECEADGFGSGGCSIFGNMKDCGGYTLHVGNFSHNQMLNEYRQGERITVRWLSSAGS